MSGKAWKQHERNVAKYFNTKRRSRGADFGETDVEVIASVSEWLGWEDTNTHIIAECKYSKYLGIVSTFRNLETSTKSLSKDKIVILRLEGNRLVERPLFLCNLDNFDSIFIDFIYHQGAYNSLLDVSKDYSIISKSMSIPKYLHEFLDQSRGYALHAEAKSDKNSPTIAFPVAVLAKANTVGRVLVFSSYDVEHLWSNLGI